MIAATNAYKTALAAFRSGALPAVISITGYARQFTKGLAAPLAGQYQWLVGIDDLATSINDLDGGANQGSLSFTVQDRGGLLTADFPGFVFEGKQVTLKVGLPGLAQADFPVMFTGYIDTVASSNSNLEYTFSCSDTSGRLSQVVFTAGDDGKPTDSSHPRTLTGHPLDMLLEILLTEVGLDASLVDSTKIQNYRDNVFSGVSFLFSLTQAPAAADFIKNQILKPLGGYLWVNSAGQVTVNFFYPLNGPVAVQTLGPSLWLTIPEAEQTDMVNTVQFQFDAPSSGAGGSSSYMALATEEYGPSISLYGQYGEHTIASDGMRSSFQGYFTARLVARMIFMRYGFKNLKFDQNAPDALWQACLLEPGDIVAVTHPAVPDRKAGVVGITAKLFEVIDRTLKYNEGLVNVTMLDAGYLSTFGNSLIAPNGEAAYTAASAPDKAKYMFLCDDTGKYSNGDAAHVLG